MEEPRRLGNRYELGAVLGRGGMAEVYMARDARLGRSVAVKTLRADMARDSTLQARFRREAQSAASLSHPSIVAVYDTGEGSVDEVVLPYIVMEYVNGSTLRDLLHSGRRILPERAMEIICGVLEALAYSHRNGIVHRDIKPANIMLNGSGAVKVMDFGIARAMGDVGMTLTQTSAVIGTAQYLSPEQAKGERIDARSDLYSTGCLLYELLTGRPPFIGDSPVAVAYQHVREAPKPPSYFDPEIPAVADAIVLKSLGKRPEERYQSADEMRADLERALDGRPIAANQATDEAEDSAVPVAEATAVAAQAEQDKPADSEPKPTDDNSADGRKPRAMHMVVGALAIILVVLSGLLLHRMVASSTPTSAHVPNIVHKNVTDARNLVHGNELTLSSYSDCTGNDSASMTIPAGQIMSQSPAPNATVSPGSVISYCVSAGAPTATLFSSVFKDSSGNPAFYTYAQVYSTLQSHDFTNIQEKTQQDDNYPSEQVIGVVNSAGVSELGQTIPINTPLFIVVSSGPGNAAVPGGLIGESCSTAADAIQNSAGKFQTNEDGYGDVVSTSPSGNALAPIGSVVTITCAPAAPPATTPSSTPSPKPKPTPTNGGFIGGL
jgi:eukaryotic-like serine/threonine-protein kinase